MSAGRFDPLTERLLQEGIAARHARRVVIELREHWQDIVAELESAGQSQEQAEAAADERLGSDDQFVECMLARHELRSWACRRPWLAFTLLPLLGFVAVFALSIAVLIGTLNITRALAINPAASPALRWLSAALMANALWVAPLAAAGTGCVLAARQRAPSRWAVAGAVVIGLLAALTQGSVRFSATEPHTVAALGFGINPDTLRSAVTRGCIMLPAVLLPYFWWLRSWRLRSRRKALLRA